MLASTRLLMPVRVVLTVLLVGLTFLAVPPAEAAPAEDDPTAEATSVPSAEETSATPSADETDGEPTEEPSDETEPAPVKVDGPKAKTKKPRKLGIRPKPRTTLAQRALGTARKQLGDPYRYGATGPGSFDCSGLVQFSYRAAGLKRIPRTSGAQASFARRVPRAAMKPGDLMFFSGSGGVYHVGIFAGRKNGKIVMLHAPSTGKRVSYASPWTNAWFAGRVA